MKKGIKLMLLAIFAITMTGCKNSSSPSNGKDNIVSFNKEELNIKVDDLYEALKTRYATNYIIQEIDKNILNLEYETDSEAESFAENRLKIYRMMYGNDENALLEALQNAGYRTIDDFKEYITTDYKRDLATDDYARSIVTDSEIKKYYDDKVYGDITISHILITSDVTNSTDEEKKENEKKANEKITEILNKLKEGKSFAEVAKEYSEDSATSKNGGRLGTFNKGEMTEKYDKEFENAVINLEVGKYTTKAVKSSYGYHIIYKDAEKDKPALETIKQMIIDNLIKDKKDDDSKMQYKAMIELRNKYGFKINDDEISSQYDNAVNNWLYGKED